MSAELSHILEVCEKLVNNSTERELFKANPQQYLKNNGLPKPSTSRQVSTVITLDIKGKGGKKAGPEKKITDKVCLSTDSDVLLVETADAQNSHIVQDTSWLDYQDGKLAFVVHIQFDQAIPENPTYRPILRIAYNDQGRSTGPRFEGTLTIVSQRYILVKKYCSFYAKLDSRQSYYDPNSDVLQINFNQSEDPSPSQQSGCYDQQPPSQQAG